MILNVSTFNLLFVILYSLHMSQDIVGKHPEEHHDGMQNIQVITKKKPILSISSIGYDWIFCILKQFIDCVRLAKKRKP